MRKTMTAACAAATLAAALTVLGPQAHAAGATWPERAVRLIVPVNAGSSPDIAARVFGDRLAERWGKPVVIENRPGADTTIGIGAFVAARDDHTLLVTVSGSYTATPQIIDKLPYDTAADLVPVSTLTSVQVAFAVTASATMRTLPEVFAAAKAEPGKLNWSSGPTLLRFLPAAYLKRHGLEMPYVTYRDLGQSGIDLGEGRIQLLYTSLQLLLPIVQSGKARLLAIGNAIRSPMFPEVPTAAEAGFPELAADGAAIMFGWRGIDAALVTRIGADVEAVAAEPEVRHKLEAGGQVALGTDAVTARAMLARQQAQVAEIAKIIDLRVAK
jgi:tripartite-type tricarboxylate transporter receptor subunit TctC